MVVEIVANKWEWEPGPMNDTTRVLACETENGTHRHGFSLGYVRHYGGCEKGVKSAIYVAIKVVVGGVERRRWEAGRK
jgi:hypothetical protein